MAEVGWVGFIGRPHLNMSTTAGGDRSLGEPTFGLCLFFPRSILFCPLTSPVPVLGNVTLQRSHRGCCMVPPLPSSQPSHGSLLPLQQRTESSSWCRTAYSLGLCPPPCPPRLPLSLAHSTPAAGAPLLFLQCTGCEGPLHMLLVLQGSLFSQRSLVSCRFLIRDLPWFP